MKDARLYKCSKCGWFTVPEKGFRGLCPKCGGAVFILVCTRCGHSWEPRVSAAVRAPRVCPRCKSPYWNRPRVKGRKVEE